MTIDEIMKIIENKGNREIDINGDEWLEIHGEDIFYIARELLERIEQDKKEMAREIMCWFSNETEKAFGKNYLAERIAKEYGVEL